MTLSRPAPNVSPSSVGVAQRLSVVHLLHTIAYGGIETLIINWLRYIDPREFEVTLVVFENPGGGGSEQPFINAATRAGLTVRTIGWSRLKPVRRSAHQLRRILDEVQAHIVHTHNTYADIVGWYATRGSPIKTIASLYVWSDLGWKRNVLQKIDQWVLKRFDLIVAQCEQTRRDTIDRGLPSPKTTVLAHGFESDPVRLTEAERREQRRAGGIDEGQVVLVNVARLYPEKAHDHLLRCFRRIVDQRPHARLWILGTGPLADEVDALRRDLGLENSVRMCGFQKDLFACLRCLDFQVHPSHAEGVPLAVASGMATGLPVIASDVGGMRELIRDGVTGILVPPAGHAEFSRSFVDAVISLIDNESERRRLGHTARELITNECSPASAARQLEDTYRKRVMACASASSS